MASSSSYSSSSSATPSQGSTYAYDVFLSFRGLDTREGFTEQLYKMLNHHGINTFIDSEGLAKGESIDKLFEYIDVSEIFVVIFSENYGNSTWCLREISRIVDSRRWIIPVFINIDPSNVRKQDGIFGVAFEEKMQDQKPEDVQKWREVLKFAGNLSGYVTKAQGNEAGVIELIAKDVVRRVKKPLYVAKHPVSIVSRVEEVLQLLPQDKEEKVSILTIAGIGGLGKSTLARGLYNNLMRNFDACCFLVNVRQSTLEKGLLSLQKQLIHDIGKQDSSVHNIDQGKSEIQRVLRWKKVLLILDDVDDKDQLEALAGEKRWFSKGSIVIITTRHKSVGAKHYQSHDCLLYEPKGLDDKESLLLFSHHAFGNDRPLSKFEKISMDLVRAAHGLPLALIVYGSHLFMEIDMKYWVEFLGEVKKRPHGDIVECLKLSYDKLNDNVKRVFLDIAKFYVGQKIEYPMYIWEASGLSPRVTVKTLVERCLIRIDKDEDEDEYESFWMHDHIKDMAKYIMSQESSRGTTPTVISTVNELRNLLKESSMGQPQEESFKHIERIICPDQYLPSSSTINNRTFDAMPNLQVLRMKGVEWRPADDSFRSSSPRFPSGLKWLEWRYSNIEMFPNWDDLNLMHLTILDLSNSDNIRGFHLNFHGLPQLRVLNLSHCSYLEELPDLRRCPQLVKLDISYCRKFRSIDGSCNIVHLHSLTHFNLSYCNRLETLAAQLPEYLVSLDASDCWSLTTISNLSNLVHLQKLDIGSCTSLETLAAQLPESLVSLDASDCSSLTTISNLSNLVHLQKLDIGSCTSLETLPPLPESLVSLDARYCPSLTTISNLSSLVHLEELDIRGSRKLRSLPGLQELRRLRGKELTCREV